MNLRSFYEKWDFKEGPINCQEKKDQPRRPSPNPIAKSLISRLFAAKKIYAPNWSAAGRAKYREGEVNFGEG